LLAPTALRAYGTSEKHLIISQTIPGVHYVKTALPLAKSYIGNKIVDVNFFIDDTRIEARTNDTVES
jgi:hypothetical protein